jgi:hypothetical protein
LTKRIPSGCFRCFAFDVTVEAAYNADGAMAALAAKNPTAGGQTTRYVCGNTLALALALAAYAYLGQGAIASEDFTQPQSKSAARIARRSSIPRVIGLRIKTSTS